MTRSLAVALSLSVALIACRSGDDAPADDVQPDAPGGSVRIQDVQNDSMAAGTPVALSGVIVTAIDAFGDRTGDIWVQEPGGGPNSGVHVFGAPIAAVSALALGDIVDIAGAEKDEFALTADTTGRTITELKAVSGGMMTVTKTGSGAVPAPMVVDALAIGQKATQAERDAEWEKWEGVLITVNNISVLTTPSQISGTMPDPTLQKFDVTGQLVIESALSAFPTTGLNKNACLASATGVVDYFFDYLLYQRATTDVMTGGTGCPVAEMATACTDTIDNDGNGFSDCADNNCVTSQATCRAATTIPALQATTPVGGIELQGVSVTALSKAVASAGNKRFNMWVQANPGIPGANESVYVFGPGVDLTPFAVGSRVNIIGTVTEFNDSTGTETLTEVKALSITAASGTPAISPVVGKTAAELTVAATGEPYEGAMVTLTNVKVTLTGTTATTGPGAYGVGTMVAGGTTFKTDDDIFLVTSATNTCFASITGVWTYLVYENAYGFLPIAAGTPGGVCP